jgi:hypothetical protein
MYRSTFSWPRHLLEVIGQLHAPAALPPRKSPQYPLDRRLGGPQSWWRRENSWPYRDSNSDSSVSQPVVSRYTDWAIPAPTWKRSNEEKREWSRTTLVGFAILINSGHYGRAIYSPRPLEYWDGGFEFHTWTDIYPLFSCVCLLSCVVRRRAIDR